MVVFYVKLIFSRADRVTVTERGGATTTGVGAEPRQTPGAAVVNPILTDDHGLQTNQGM